MRRLSLLLLLLLPSLAAWATGGRDSLSVIRRVDNSLYRRYHRSNVDTAYIAIPEQRWRFSTAATGSMNSLQLSHLENGAGFQIKLNSAPTYSQDFTVAWHGLSVGAGINPAWFFPRLKNSDQAYTFSLNDNMFGMVATIRITNSLQGQVISLPDSTVSAIPAGHARDLTASFDAYYALNGKRFSMPAAFSQSQIQKKSAGSVLLSASLRSSISGISPVTGYLRDSTAVLSHMLSLGGGYGHNFVTPHHWLLHVSFVTNLTVLQYTRLTEGLRQQRMQQTFPDFVSNLQLAALHWTDRWFYGAYATIRSSIYGDIRRYDFNNTRWVTSIFVGYRL